MILVTFLTKLPPSNANLAPGQFKVYGKRFYSYALYGPRTDIKTFCGVVLKKVKGESAEKATEIG